MLILFFTILVYFDSMIKVVNLNKTYPGGISALNDITFGLEPGEICGYIGVNGAGKSTTIKILCGILGFDSGQISIHGLDLPGRDLDVKRISGYVPESGDLFDSLSVIEYMEFIRDVRNLEQTVFSRRLGYFTELFRFGEFLDISIGKLSKGNKQKVLIVSALLHNPDVLFLDEPLNGLDAFSIITLQDMVAKLAEKGKTVFYCSHLLDIMEKISTRIIIIEKGGIKLNKLKSELSSSPDYKSLEVLFRDMAGGDNRMTFSYDEAFC
ncbi:MAG: ABC transporter ATP-binding protein [Ignavibacteria bacterium]|nr:ABC transporter ATP-binding protein [Ignavibacteria bacterium]